MNIVLLQPDDFVAPATVCLRGRRAAHIHDLLRPAVGDQLKVGIVDGNLGHGKVAQVDADAVVMHVTAEDAPPPLLPLTLLLALPRPRMLGRILQVCATFGVRSLWLLQTERVERSFWQTPLLQPDAITAQFDLGLEQARATQRPELRLFNHRRGLSAALAELSEPARLLLHPGSHPALGSAPETSMALAIGPEGGFTEPEVATLQEAGFVAHSLGARILRVETAVVAALGRLYL